ncbi:MAG: glycosyltransferase family 2 protein [Alphaproteobacteria bacterium]|nr:glycosyltransferase family 2 protein [Alphaproteobacteria bacterium]
MAPSVSVLVVNYRSGPLLASCLRALAAQTSADFEAIVVDNGSDEGSVEQAQAAVAGDRRFVFDLAGENLGFSAGNNRAARQASGMWLAMLNPDAFPAPEWLACLLDAARRYPTVAMFGSTQLDASDSARLDGAGDNYFFAGVPWRGGYGWPATALLPEGEVFSPCGAAALYRRDAFEAAGGFDEKFFCYVEDVDLAFRLRLLGHRCIQVPGAVVRHVGGAASGGSESAFARFHGLRNIVWCFVKNMPGPLFWPLLPIHTAILVLLLVRAVPRSQALVVARALGAALAGVPGIWAERRKVQAARRVSWITLARSLTWSPWAYARRAPLTQAAIHT